MFRWLITGCSTGIGREIALAALAAGHQVAATARRPETIADIAAANSSNRSGYRIDLLTSRTSQQIAAAVTDDHRRITGGSMCW